MTGCPHHGLAGAEGCRPCWLYWNDPAYNRLWGGDGTMRPSIWRQLIGAVGAVVVHVASGAQSVTDEEKRRRLTICEACEMFRPDRGCQKCGCNMDVKAGWKEQKCPLDKW